MNKKVEHIGNQYTSQKIRKTTTKMKMRVVRRRIALFGGILLAIILILLVLSFKDIITIKMQLKGKRKKLSFKTTR